MIVEEGQSLGSVVLHHKIADGGMGSVWAGEDSALGHRVAIKFLSTEQWMDPEGAERFSIEARMATKIESPYVPRVYRNGTCEDGTPFMVMELVEGVELTTWLAEHGPVLDAPHVARLLDQIASALTAAHKVGVVHRDVKPENVILSGGLDDFEAKLIDFGIAKSLRASLPSPSLTRTGSIVGTPIYMSPEQLFSAREVDERSDLWSLAVVAYRCLTGQFPFDSETFAGLCVAIQNAHVTPVTELRPELPFELDRWFDKALARDPGDRFESAEIMSKMFRVAIARPSNWTRPLRMPLVTAAIDAVFDGVSHTTRRIRGAVPWKPQGRTTAYIGGGSAVGLCVGIMLFAAPWAAEPARHATRLAMTPVASQATLTAASIPAPAPAIPKVAATSEVGVRHASKRLEERPAAVARAIVPQRSSSLTLATVASTKPAPAPEASSRAPASVVNAAGDAGTTTPAITSAEPPPPDPHDWKPSDELGEP